MNTIEQISLGSPWWNNPDWEKYDRSLVAASQSGITLRHLEPYRIKFPCFEIIRGPRQIGKTTEIKMIIKELIHK